MNYYYYLYFEDIGWCSNIKEAWFFFLANLAAQFLLKCSVFDWISFCLCSVYYIFFLVCSGIYIEKCTNYKNCIFFCSNSLAVNLRCVVCVLKGCRGNFFFSCEFYFLLYLKWYEDTCFGFVIFCSKFVSWIEVLIIMIMGRRTWEVSMQKYCLQAWKWMHTKARNIQPNSMNFFLFSFHQFQISSCMLLKWWPSGGHGHSHTVSKNWCGS